MDKKVKYAIIVLFAHLAATNAEKMQTFRKQGGIHWETVIPQHLESYPAVQSVCIFSVLK